MSTEPVSKVDSNNRSRRFRWRTLPVALIGGFGAIGCAMGIGLILLMAVTAWTGEQLYKPGPPAGFSQLGLTIAGYTVICGGLLIWAAQQLWEWHWKTALGILAMCILASQLARYFELLPE